MADQPQPVLQWRWRERIVHNDGDSDWGSWEGWEDIPAGESFHFEHTWEFETRVKPADAPKSVPGSVSYCPSVNPHAAHGWNKDSAPVVCPGHGDVTPW
jgi:hypothetical protein